MKRPIMLAVFVFLSFMILSAGIAQQKADEKVACPVSGETMLKSQAKATCEYVDRAIIHELRDRGFLNLLNLEGGTIAWKYGIDIAP